MNWKTRETLKEIRLWTTQVIVPVTLGIALYLKSHPEAEAKLEEGREKCKSELKSKLNSMAKVIKK